VCTGGGANTTTSGSTATIGVDPGETIVCTFTNKKDATVKIIKQADPETNQSFDFSGTFGPFALVDDGADDDATPNNKTFTVSGTAFGSKTVTEDGETGWDLTDITCTGTTNTGANPSATFDVNPGDTILCTFSNISRGSIEITKNDNGQAATGQFTFSLSGGPDSLPGCGDPPDPTASCKTTNANSESNVLTFSDLKPGEYTLCEIVPDNYSSSLGGGTGCETITLGGDNELNPKFTVDNTPCPQGGTITIDKTITAIGHAVTFQFHVTGPNGFTADPQVPFAANETHNSVDVLLPAGGVGDYHVTEDPPPFPYSPGPIPDPVAIGVTNNCAQTLFLSNNFAPGELTLTKTEQFGSGTPRDAQGHWQFYINGPDNFHQDKILNQDGNGFGFSIQNLTPGDYTVCEKHFLSWQQSFTVNGQSVGGFTNGAGDRCVTITVADDSIVTITVANLCPNGAKTATPKVKKKRRRR
jgi:plastocyanin